MTRRRRALPDDPALPERAPRARRGARRRSGSRSAPRWLGERELDLARYERRGRLRLDVRVVHARAPRGARERRLLRRALLHLLRGDRPLPAHQAGRLGDPPPAADDDPPPRRQGRRQPEDGRAGRLRADAVRPEALLAGAPRALPRHPRPALSRPRGADRLERSRALRRRPSRPAHALEARRAALRRAASARASPSGPPWRHRHRCVGSLPAARRSGPARRRARARSRRHSARRRGRPRGRAAGRCAGRAAGAEPRPAAPARARARRSSRRSP